MTIESVPGCVNNAIHNKTSANLAKELVGANGHSPLLFNVIDFVLNLLYTDFGICMFERRKLCCERDEGGHHEERRIDPPE